MIFYKIIMGLLLSGLILLCGCITINVYNDHEISHHPPIPAKIPDNPSPVRTTEDIPPAGNWITIKPLVKAGTPFDSSAYPQNTPQSDTMAFQCYWDGTGTVYISGNKSSLTGIYADDGYTITVQPSGVTFDSPEHYGHQHPVVDLTRGMRPGLNNFTLIIQNWQGLSMSYGSVTGIGSDQDPYIVQVGGRQDLAQKDTRIRMPGIAFS